MNRLLTNAMAVWLLCGMISGRPAGAAVLLRNEFCLVEADPATLQVKINKPGQPAMLVSMAQTDFGVLAHLVASVTNAAWSYPDRGISVSLSLDGPCFMAHIRADAAGEFTFPVLGAADPVRGWILPMFEGVYAPCGDARWAAFLTHYGAMNTTADFTMPFVGLDCGNFTLTYIFTNAFNNALSFKAVAGGGLEGRFTHQFTRNHPVKEYGVIVQIGAASPVAPALLYRRWLQQRGDFVTMKEKIQRTPAAAKLLGAVHIYLWGGEWLHHTDVKNWKQFCLELKQKGEALPASPAQRVWSLLQPGTKAFVAQLPGEEWPDQYTKRQITDDLNRLLARPDLSGAAGGESAAEIYHANGRWLAEAFPGLLASPETWGDGVSPKMIQQLAAAGLDRLWLGCDGWDAFINRPETVVTAKAAGYLIGPYDSFNSIHRPDDPDTWETAQFGEALYQTGAIINADGQPRRGFKKKGFTLSPVAARPYVEQRVTRLMNQFHANSWFVDCDGFGDYFDDYSPAHPATQQSDLAARIARMQWIRDTFGAVIGTEGCSAGVASTVHFAHGVMTPVIGWGDPDLTNPKSKFYTGGYYPPDGPKNFFMPVPIKEEYRYIYFEPRFRLPLFQTVFHDSVIATHHWSYGSFKTKDLARTVELLELLYNVPPLYHLNLEEFQRRKTQIQRHYTFFSPLHRRLAEVPLTDFQYLTDDRAVQQTTFGDQIDLVANFSQTDFKFGGTVIPPRSILSQGRGGEKPLLYTP